MWLGQNGRSHDGHRRGRKSTSVQDEQRVPGARRDIGTLDFRPDSCRTEKMNRHNLSPMDLKSGQ